jgi:SAM-dependent methyltransferase
MNLILKRDSLRVATEGCYWKPAKAFFYAFELEEYVRAGIYFTPPTMDLGCGDGIFATMLKERGLLDHVDIAIDYSLKDLRKIRKGMVHNVVRADARFLPLKSVALNSVFANCMLHGLHSENDLKQVLLEVHRVLVEQGLFVLTEPTPLFFHHLDLVIPKILRKIGFSWLASFYLMRLKKRAAIQQVFSEEEWLKKLAESHLHVKHIGYYITPRQALWWNLLMLHLLRGIALLKLLPVSWIKQQTARLQEKIFRPVFKKEQSISQVSKQNQAGYILIVAHKASLQPAN